MQQNLSSNLGVQSSDLTWDAYLDPFIGWLQKKPKEKVLADRNKFLSGDAERRAEILVGYCKEWLDEITTGVSFHPLFDNREVKRDHLYIIEHLNYSRRQLFDFKENTWKITPVLECNEVRADTEGGALASVESFASWIGDENRTTHDLALTINELGMVRNSQLDDAFFNSLVTTGHETVHILQKIAKEDKHFYLKCLKRPLPEITMDYADRDEFHAHRIHRKFSSALVANFLSLTLAKGHDFQI